MPKIIRKHGQYVLRTRSKNEMLSRPKFFIEWTDGTNTRWIVGSDVQENVEREFNKLMSGYVVEMWPTIKPNVPYVRDGDYHFFEESAFRNNERQVYCNQRIHVERDFEARHLAYILDRDPNVGWVAIFGPNGELVAENYRDPNLRARIYADNNSIAISM